MTDQKESPFRDINTLTGRLFMEADEAKAAQNRERQERIDNLTEDDMRRAFRIARVEAPDQPDTSSSVSPSLVTKAKRALGKFWSP